MFDSHSGRQRRGRRRHANDGKHHEHDRSPPLAGDVEVVLQFHDSPGLGATGADVPAGTDHPSRRQLSGRRGARRLGRPRAWRNARRSRSCIAGPRAASEVPPLGILDVHRRHNGSLRHWGDVAPQDLRTCVDAAVCEPRLVSSPRPQQGNGLAPAHGLRPLRRSTAAAVTTDREWAGPTAASPHKRSASRGTHSEMTCDQRTPTD